MLADWMRSIADRLRRVRVCCGDWERVCTDGACAHGSIVGVFLDPPYSGDAKRNTAIYRCEDLDVSKRVNAWCLSKTEDARFRVVLAGYEGEHENLESMGWKAVHWKTRGGFANFADDVEAQGKKNRGRERLWCSPSCRDEQPELFG
jgi:site-specific DNA-adenine methylase